MKRKMHVAIVCGGKSAEHEISVLSTQHILNTIDREKYTITVMGIDKKGEWFLHDKPFVMEKEQTLPTMEHSGKDIMYCFNQPERSKTVFLPPIDVIFPLLHGPYGEDGTVQGLLKLANIPFVGSAVLGSAVAMDKDVTKRLLRDAGIPVAKFLVVREAEKELITFEDIQKTFDLPFFIKPANLGSSVGVTKVTKKTDFSKALDLAFSFDTKILIEEGISGREIECSVLGNSKKIASIPGEVIPHDTFYSYKAKYLDKDGAELVIPAQLTRATVKKLQLLAIETCKTLCIDGMARVDFFLKNDKTILVNEVNTIPGFTTNSMYPKLWEASGISQSDLFDRLIQLAMERFSEEALLATSCGKMFSKSVLL